MSRTRQEARPVQAMRVRHGEGVLDLCGEEAAALGSRALVISSNRPETRESRALESLGRVLRRVRVGHHPFPHVPRPSRASGPSAAQAAEAARESRCRLVIGLGDHEPLNVARETGARTLLPCILLPTAVGFGDPVAADTRPLPQVLIADPRLSAGSPPGRTRWLGLVLFAGLMERYTARELPVPEAAVRLAEALQALVDALPGAVEAPDDPLPRAALAGATAAGAEAIQAAGRGPTPVTEWTRRLAPAEEGRCEVLAGLVPALLEAGSEGRGPLGREPVAELGRAVLGVREADAGRAASWAAGGIRQWIVNLGLRPELPAAAAARARADAEIREALAAALR